MTIDPDGSLTFIRGDDVRVELQFFENDGETPIDLGGFTVTSQLRAKVDGFVMADFEVEISGEPPNTVILSIPHDTTEGFRLTEAVYDVQVTDPDGLVETVMGPATVTIIKDVTKE